VTGKGLADVMGHSLPMHSAPVSNNVRYGPKATIQGTSAN